MIDDTIESIRRKAKRSRHSKAVGFYIARMSDSTYDWFPADQSPNIHGVIDEKAKVVERWAYHGAWRQLREEACVVEWTPLSCSTYTHDVPYGDGER